MLSEKESIEVMDEFLSAYETDDESHVKKARRLENTYKVSSKEDRFVIDNIFITLCGYSLRTLLDRRCE